MFTNRNNSYLPFIVIIVAALLLALVGFVSGLGDFNAARQNATPETSAALANMGSTALTEDGRPISPVLRDSSDSLTVALYGEMANGGYWRWDDMVNLLGVYGTAGQFQTATVAGTTYNGVPLSYLLRYAQINSGTDRLILRTRDGREYLYELGNVDDFAAYIISTAPNNTLVVVPPSNLALNMISGLGSIRAERTEQTNNMLVQEQDILIPASPDTLSLVGSIDRGGQWTWTDLNNLLNVYANGTPTTVTTSRGTFTGVPVPYLAEYAVLQRALNNLVFLYTRSGTEYTTTAAITECADCIIVLADDGSLTLVRPGKDPEVLPELAAIYIP